MATHSEKPAGALIGMGVISASGETLGRVIAVIHHDRGCDLLVEDARWWRRRRRLRLSEEEVTAVDATTLQRRPAVRISLFRAGGSDDDAVA